MGGFDWLGDLAESAGAAMRSTPGEDVAAWAIGLVFIWSGVAKLQKPRLAALAMMDFGVVGKPKAAHGLVFGGIECLLGAAALLGVGSAAPMVAMTALLLVFCLIIARALIAGRRFPCMCFGDSEDALSTRTLARTAALALLGLIVVTAPQAPSLSVTAFTSTTWLTLVVSTSVVAMSALVGRIGLLLRLNAEVVDHFRARAKECRP